MKTISGIVLKIKDSAFGAVATLADGTEVRVSHRDYWRHLQEKEDMPSGYEAVPYMNGLHLITIPNPIYVDED